MNNETMYGWLLVAVLIGGVLVGVQLASAYQRDLFCPALLEHADTGTDSITVAQEFGGCLDHLREDTTP